jgi:hypothetical protein
MSAALYIVVVSCWFFVRAGAYLVKADTDTRWRSLIGLFVSLAFGVWGVVVLMGSLV